MLILTQNNAILASEVRIVRQNISLNGDRSLGIIIVISVTRSITISSTIVVRVHLSEFRILDFFFRNVSF